jgi:peptidoglycan-associated lipoprotein
VLAACDPCRIEVGKISTLSAVGQDPDGDRLTYAWTVATGTFANRTNPTSPWTAPMQVGTVPFTVTVNDGKGGTASDRVNVEVIAPAAKVYTIEDIYFDFDRYTLLPDARAVLDQVVTAMKADTTLLLAIEGRTDNIGTNDYNMALGQRRAAAAHEYLTSHGIATSRLNVTSRGEENPKFSNAREETRTMNRSVALTLRLTRP